MKLKKIPLGILAAIATFTFGVFVYKSVGFVASFVHGLTVKPATAEQILPQVEIPAVPVFAEPIFVGPTANEASVGKDDEQESNWSGEYYLNEENLPKAFSDISYLDIQTHEYNEKAVDDPLFLPIAPKGSIQTKIALRFDRIAIGGKQISLQTATVNGVSYKFAGRFLDHKDYSETDDDMPSLKGRLIKIKDNKWAAEIEAKFYVSGC